MRRPIQVLVYPIRWRDGSWQYLLLHRTPELGGFWQGVTGGVEEGEEIIDTARRELWEETGLAPLQIESLDFTYSFPLAPRWQHLYAPGTSAIIEHTFVARVPATAEASLSFEHDARRWCDRDEALGLLVWPENREALRRAAAKVRSEAIQE